MQNQHVLTTVYFGCENTSMVHNSLCIKPIQVVYFINLSKSVYFTLKKEILHLSSAKCTMIICVSHKLRNHK